MAKNEASSPPFVLSDLRQVKALADPLRQSVLGAFGGEAKTTKQVAERLGEKPTKLYHHVETLERVGLLKLVKKRQNRGTVEKYYQAVGGKFTVDPALFGHFPKGKQSAIERAFASAFETALAEIRHGLDKKLLGAGAQQPATLLAQTQFRATPREVARLRAQIETLMKKVRGKSSVRGDHYRILVVCYPLMTPVGPGAAQS
jgi:DNA-binding transcriptional ArsR family regulator